MTCLITGATGAIGSLVTEQLIAHGERPRVFVRNEAKARARFGSAVDAFTGDLADTKTLEPALRDADTLLLLNFGPNLAAQDAAAAHAAKSAGVKHLVKLSSYDANENVGTGVWHAQGEAAIRTSGIPFTFVQPSGFMSNAAYWAHSIEHDGVVRSCTGDGKIPFIHPKDIAAVTVEALTSSKYQGQSLTITGPEPLSYAEMAAKIGAAIGKTIRFEPISEEQVRLRMERDGDSPADIEAHLSIYRAIREGRLAKPTSVVEQILGRNPLTFDHWLKENLIVFSPCVGAQHAVPHVRAILAS
jgi:uncharacterized protein YbjT (DUF2867 family)